MAGWVKTERKMDQIYLTINIREPATVSWKHIAGHLLLGKAEPEACTELLGCTVMTDSNVV